MYVFFEDGGRFHAGRILSHKDASLQVELDSGKRVKLKQADALVEFAQPEPAHFIAQASAMAAAMDIDLAWEFAAQDEFHFTQLAGDYFGTTAAALEQAASAMCLYGAPHYFRRLGKGRFKKASSEIVAQALAAIEKKKQLQAQIDTWSSELVAARCPEPIREQLYKILFHPNKNSPEYKALVQATRASQTPALTLLQKAGAIRSAYEFHWQRFIAEHFPKGIAFAALPAVGSSEELPLASVQAFSIDDSQTTEIDDALSLQNMGSGLLRLGIHIAAPALAIQTGSALDQLARERYSTVYMPGQKITMLPSDVISLFSLAQGKHCPALSLYLDIEEETLAIQSSQTCLERVYIAHNLRHDHLQDVVTPAWLGHADDASSANTPPGAAPQAEPPQELKALQQTLSFLYRFAQQRKAQREIIRGKPENFNRPDYDFKVRSTGPALSGNEAVDITERARGSALDLIVAECMIVANNTWGQWLAQCGVPGIYRSQASLAPGVKVKMGTKALPHAGIGVSPYAWSTSPLRRYVDLVNQWQLIACVRHGATAPLSAPFKPKDAQLLAIVSGFEARYSAYAAFQSAMERYWAMQYLRQRGITELEASVIKDGYVRAQDIPLVMLAAQSAALPRGTKVKVRLASMDDFLLEASAQLLECHSDATPSPSAPAQDEEESEGEDTLLAPALAFALDTDESLASGSDTSSASANATNAT